MAKKDDALTPEQIGKTFRIKSLRPAAALGKPDGFADVMRRTAERAPARQRPERKPPREER